jgi:hypothetical protein
MVPPIEQWREQLNKKELRMPQCCNKHQLSINCNLPTNLVRPRGIHHHSLATRLCSNGDECCFFAPRQTACQLQVAEASGDSQLTTLTDLAYDNTSTTTNM